MATDSPFNRSSLVRVLARIWFRSLQREGREPAAGATLYVLNHPNSLVDPLVVSALLVRRPRFLAKAALYQVRILRPILAVFDPIPVHRRQDGDVSPEATARTFASAHAALSRGEAIAMFPEGVSHARRELAPLKTGAARILLTSPVNVQLVPAGLVYGQREQFRHSVLLRIGEPVDYSDLSGNGADPAAVRELTERIRSALLPLTLHGADDDVQALAERVAWLLAEAPPDRARLEPLRARVRLLEQRLRSLPPGALEEIESRVTAATRALEDEGIRPDQVANVYSPEIVSGWARGFAGRLLLLPFIVTVGSLFWPAYRVNGAVVDRLALDRDSQATYKVIVGLLLFPAWIVLLSGIAIWQAGFWAALAVPVAAVAAFLSLPLAERVREDAQAIRAFLRRGHPRRRALLEERLRLLEAFPELANVVE